MRMENISASKRLGRLLAMILALALVVFVPGCSKAEGSAEDQSDEPETEETAYEDSIYGDASLGIDAGVDEELRDYRCILLAGIDNGHRADMQMVLCMNKETGETKMFTVTRSTYMQVGHGETVTIDDHELEFCKSNRAYEIGDKYDLMKEINRHLDLNIKEFIGIDWATTAKLVDLLGGLEVDIESQEMLDAINDLISDFPDGDAELIPSVGRQTLTGWQAVQYLRVRKYDGGNVLKREERSREVVSSLFEKAKDLSIEEISDIYDEIADDLDTNVSRNTLTDIFTLIAAADIENCASWPYEYKVRWEPDKYFDYYVPQTLYSNVKELHANLFDQQDYLPSTTVQEIDDKIKDLEENYLK